MEKTFSSLKPLVDADGKSKFCLKCGSGATQEALFDVDGYTHRKILWYMRSDAIRELIIRETGMAPGFYLSGTKVIVTHKLNLELLKRIIANSNSKEVWKLS
jgi:hypothetical protein